jgi:predicted transglutaminase-like cysteine proteinase
MFGRVAAWGFATFLVVVLLVALPAQSGIETGTRVEAKTRATEIAAAHEMTDPPGITAHNETEKIESAQAAAVRVEVRSEPQVHAPADAQWQAPAKLTALDRAGPVTAPPPTAEPFGLAAISVTGGNVLTKWRSVEADIRADNEVLEHCREGAERCPAAGQNFLAIIAQGRAQTGRARIGVINRAINLAIEPMSDLAQWAVPDRWSAPLETFTTGRGDCEDYAIAKYVALTAAGVAPEDVKLVIVRNTALGEDHAVVTVRLDGAWIVLDNRWLTLVADGDMQQAIPRFVLDGDGVRQFAQPVLIASRRVAAPASF